MTHTLMGPERAGEVPRLGRGPRAHQGLGQPPRSGSRPSEAHLALQSPDTHGLSTYYVPPEATPAALQGHARSGAWGEAGGAGGPGTGEGCPGQGSLAGVSKARGYGCEHQGEGSP